MDNRPAHPLMWLATALGMVAIVAVVGVVGLLYGMRWLATQPTSVTNPVYLLIGIIIIGVLLIGHDAVDAWGDAFKARASAPVAEPMDLDTQYRVAQTAERMALARKYDREGIAPARPSYADDALPPWPAQENGGTHPPEFTGG